MTGITITAGWGYRTMVRDYIKELQRSNTVIDFDEDKGWFETTFYIRNLRNDDVIKLKNLIYYANKYK